MGKLSKLEYIKSIAGNLNERFMDRHSPDNSLNLDILKLVEKLGGQVCEQGYVQINGNSLEVMESDGSFNIYVSAVDNEKRQKFTIAHELGHYIIHYLGGDPESRKTVYFRTSYAQGGLAEYEANVFAANLLMPESKFRECFEDRDGDLSAIADDFGVSIAAAEVRARSLGLLD